MPLADHQGVFEYDVESIWSAAFGLRPEVTVAVVQGWLDDLEHNGLFVRYQRDGKWLAAWLKYQPPPPPLYVAPTLPPPPFDNTKSLDELHQCDPLVERLRRAALATAVSEALQPSLPGFALAPPVQHARAAKTKNKLQTERTSGNHAGEVSVVTPAQVTAVHPALSAGSAPPPSAASERALSCGHLIASRGQRHYVTAACSDWKARYGICVPPGDRIGAAMKRLCGEVAKVFGGCQECAWATVRPVWQRYLSQRESSVANPQEFAGKFQEWWSTGGRDKVATRASVADKSRAAQAEYLARKAQERECNQSKTPTNLPRLKP